MKEKESKFTLEKFEVVRLKDLRFVNGGSPETVTLTSSNCSTKPTCKDIVKDDPAPPSSPKTIY